MEANGLTGVVPFTYFGGAGKAVGSTFLRVNGLVANHPNFEIWQHGHRYDNLIFQKAYWPEMMRVFKGPKILDLCDPDWITGGTDIIETGSLADAITCSSETLTKLMKGYFPHKIVEHVPDRLDFKLFVNERPQHKGQAKNVVWFGFIHNAFEALAQLCPAIQQYRLNLTLIADYPYTRDDHIRQLKPQFIKYDQQTAYSYIQQADIVLNPRSEKALYKYKSNNKSIIAWKAGLPVAESITDIERFLNPEERNKEVTEKQVVVNNEYNIALSAIQYKKIIDHINSNRLD